VNQKKASELLHQLIALQQRLSEVKALTVQIDFPLPDVDAELSLWAEELATFELKLFSHLSPSDQGRFAKSNAVPASGIAIH